VPLDRAGFPAAPQPQLVPDATVCQLTMEAGAVTQQVIIGCRQAQSLPGYGEAFGILDRVIGQLSGGAAPRSQKC
jgi:hypothetical protein